MFTLIDNIENLSFLNEELLLKPYVGLDTEFRRTSKDNMRLALLQINDGDETYIVDTLKISNPCEAVSFLFSDSVVKVLHSCKEDIEAIYTWTNDEIINIFDTQIAFSLLNNEFSISYQALVEKDLDIYLEKKETRSNWLRRPLTDEQLKYASLDVEYLIYIYLKQKESLMRNSKLDWLEQDIVKLKEETLNRSFSSDEHKRTISKREEDELLFKFDKIVKEISLEKEISPTLFFSKKVQKEFLRTIQNKGFNYATNKITSWRAELIRDKLLDLFDNSNVLVDL